MSKILKLIQFKYLFEVSEADQVSSIPLHLRYDVALLYLQQANYDLDLAIATYLADEKWEKEHPMEGRAKGNGKQKPGRRKYGMGTGLSGQL